MKIQGTIRKTLAVVAQVAVVKCAMYGDFDYFNGADMYNGNNRCGGTGRGFETLDDSYYYGGNQNQFADSDVVAGCNTGRCGISMESNVPAIGGGAYPSEDVFQAYPGAISGNAYNQTYQPYPVADAYEMSTGYFNTPQPVAQVSNSYPEVYSQIAPVYSDPTVHAPTCAFSQNNATVAQQVTESFVSNEATEPISILLNGSVPVNMQPTTITLGDHTYPLNNASVPAISAPAPISLGEVSMHELDFSAATITPLPSLTKEEIAAAEASAAGITVAQLKKDEKTKEADGKGKKGKVWKERKVWKEGCQMQDRS
ncbi:hypothetical protein NEQG_00428 [Nematocida parisii ERTm3]|uniref:Uncharacterized protein n=1 Tax=Nematocida parisii (strain ERTm3) TaxID=935791 RepID=I3EKB1_NEMP3|nr:hypothetical protein NEQG_00428 [Nematocida parisii ERTm3]